MADSPGHYTIPALTVSWWDTQTNQSRTATIPARTLSILPAAGSTVAAASGPPAPAAQPHPAATPPRHSQLPSATAQPASVHSSSEWEWISLALAIIWLSTLGGWAWSRRSRAAPSANSGKSTVTPKRPPGPHKATSDASKERAAFRAACEANDAHAARAHLLSWAAALRGAPPTGINAVAATISDAAVVELLRDLDRACYAGGAWQGRSLAAALTELPAAPIKTARQRDGLSPLYP